MNKKSKMVRARHTSLEMPDPEAVTKNKRQDFGTNNKKPDVLSRARTKFLTLGDALKSNKTLGPEPQIKKSMTQATLEYFFKSNKDRNHVFANTRVDATKRASLQKQNSVGAYPIKIEISVEDEDDYMPNINRARPATVCIDKVSARDTDALALERPRKKISFREPDVVGFEVNNYGTLTKKIMKHTEGKPNGITNGILHRTNSADDFDLESQAMRVVRTVGQAFEVCHKLSINAPEHENLDQDEQDTLTQDLLSDRFSDNASDKPKKDMLSEGASDKMSLPPDDSSYKDSFPENNKNQRTPQLDILPPPPEVNTRKTPLSSAETYASPHSDALTSGCSGGSGSGSLPPAGSNLSAHHEIQLMKEQLEQQTQQTQAAMAQLQLTMEKLAAEKSARREAQKTTHQLLIHNKELLDHIAELVARLQRYENAGQQQTPPHLTMPQLTATAKVERWFELLEPMSLSRPESGFVSCQDPEADEVEDDERAILEGTTNLLAKLSARKQRKLLGLKLGKVTTF